MMKEDCSAKQLIDGDGNFNAAGLDKFVKEVKLAECGLSYAVVAIMGPQSSGKSTLMNHLFHTNFREMDAHSGRSQTTKGIWIAKCVGIEPCTIGVDLEGADGSERGADDTFEKQSALFALAISDVVMINMWCNDIGRENAANRPLLRIIFQVMMRLFSPRKTTLLFVIRDKSTKTPLELLELKLRKDVHEIWDAVPKPEAHKCTPHSEFFNVQVVALSNYEYMEETFKEEVAQLRQRFYNSISQGGIAGDRKGAVPASGLSSSAQEIWKAIKQNKDLDLSSLNIMVATVRCEAIADEKLSQFMESKEWLALQNAAKTGFVSDFGKRLSSVLDMYLSEYEKESMYFDEGVRKMKRLLLKSKALESVYDVYTTMLEHLCSKALKDFKLRLEKSLIQGERFYSSVRTCTQSSMVEFRQGCADAAVKDSNWNFFSLLEKLGGDIDAYVSSVHTAKLLELSKNCEKQLLESYLTRHVEALFEDGGEDMWVSIRKVLNCEMESAISKLSTGIVGFELSKEKVAKMEQSLRNYARNVVEQTARDKATTVQVLNHMKNRFSKEFLYASDSKPRVWKKKKQILTITRDAQYASLKLLSVMATIDLDERPNNVEEVLKNSLIEGTGNHLTSSNWQNVSSEDTLITPEQCQLLWDKFLPETGHLLNKASSAVKDHKLKKAKRILDGVAAVVNVASILIQ